MTPQPTTAAPRPQRWGIRARTTAVAFLVLASILITATLGLFLGLRIALADSAITMAERDIDTVALAMDRHLIEDPATGTARLDTAIVTYLTDNYHSSESAEQGIIILNDAGRTLLRFHTNPPDQDTIPTGPPPVSSLPIGKQVTSSRWQGMEFRDIEGNVWAARGVSVQGHHYTIIVFVSLETEVHTLFLLQRALFISAPLALIVGTLVIWLMLGRALAPVRRMAKEISNIDDPTLPQQRVTVPPTNDSIATVGEQLNTMLDHLDLSQRQQKEFILNASHELKTPIAVLQTTLEVETEIAREDPNTSPETLHQFTTLLRQTQRLSELVTSLLTLSRLDAGTTSGDLKTLNIATLLRHRIADYQLLSRHQVLLTLPPGETALYTVADAQHLTQVLHNLLSNAERYAHSQIVTSLSATTDTITITVDDDGEPIPVEDRERIFHRFVRLDDSRNRETGGSGLGLALCRELLTTMNGTISATEATMTTASGDTTVGTRFTVTLPLAEAPAAS